MEYTEKKVRDLMRPIEEYDMVDIDTLLCNALVLLRKVRDDQENGARRFSHKTLFVTDEDGKIVGILGMYDYIKALVPEPAKKTGFSRAYYSLLSSRALEVANEIGEMKKQYDWLHTNFTDLVKQEAGKKVKDIMSPVHPLLEVGDPVNKAVYVMFKEGIRQPLVLDKGQIVGVLRLLDVFEELMAIAGDKCFLSQE